jgi:hypothetical protein
MIIGLLLTYGMDLFLAICFMGVIYALYRKGRYDLVSKIIYNLVVEAESIFGDKTGSLKYLYCIEKFYDKLPITIRLIFTKNEIDSMIEQSVAKLKAFLKK